MAHPLSQAEPVWCLSMPQRSFAVRVHFGAVPHGAASAAARCTNPRYDFNDAALPLGKSLRATGREKVATTIEYLKANSPLAKSGQLTLSW